MKKQVKILLLSSALSLGAHADEDLKKSNPDLEFFEFLGRFETEDGQWLDPMDIEKMLNLMEKEKTKVSIDE